MLKGFREFVMRGNVIDLAVAVVIGGAFATVVDSVVSAVIEPVLNSFGGAEAEGLGFYLISSNESTYVDLAAVINALLVFLITAAVVYFIFVLPMNKFNERRLRGRDEPEEEVAEDIALLRDIRDLLGRQTPGAAGGANAPSGGTTPGGSVT